MLTRLVRIQLAIFTVASVIGIVAMIIFYMQVPTLLGIGRMTVRLELPATGGLYRFSNVTYRGVTVGEVTAIQLTPTGVVATMSLKSSPRIPADLQANVRSMSAVGEQYVDLNPRTDSGPFLHDGSVIPRQASTVPQPVGPMLNQLSSLLGSIPQDKLSALLGESFKGLNGSGYDIGSLVDSSARVAADINSVSERARTFIDDSTPLLDSQVESSDSIRIWAHSLAGITEQVRIDDSQVRTILRTGPDAVNEVSRLLEQIKPTLPVLLANLTTVGQVLLTYNPALEQLLVLLPPTIASTQSFGLAKANPQAMTLGDFAIGLGDPPACTVGFIPPSMWRTASDTTDADTPDGLYCKLPQDSPLAVRGARNYPCMGHPGKRAPTVQICDSPDPYLPLAMRQHVLGPYPFDPNLVGQGVPLDDRLTFHDQIYAPVTGTPPPSTGPTPQSGPSPPDAPASAPPPGGVAPPPEAPNPTVSGAPTAPSSFTTNPSQPQPLITTAEYDPYSGAYVGADQRMYQQSDLTTGQPRTWKDMLPK